MTFTKEEKYLMILDLLDKDYNTLSDKEKNMIDVYWMGYIDGNKMMSESIMSVLESENKITRNNQTTATGFKDSN